MVFNGCQPITTTVDYVPATLRPRSCRGVRGGPDAGTSTLPTLAEVVPGSETWNNRDVLKGQDIVVLVELLATEPGWTIRGVGDAVELAPGPVHRSLGRLADAGLYDAKRRRVVWSAAEEFLLHGLRFVFPARPQGEVRGDPTAWAAAPLKDLVASVDLLPPVWPAADGAVRGLALEPLHPGAVAAARHRPETAERLALLDALRAGDARVRGLAAEQLRQRLQPAIVPV